MAKEMYLEDFPEVAAEFAKMDAAQPVRLNRQEMNARAQKKAEIEAKYTAVEGAKESSAPQPPKELKIVCLVETGVWTSTRKLKHKEIAIVSVADAALLVSRDQAALLEG